MKIIVTIIPEDLFTNSLLSFLSFLTNQKQESGFQQLPDLINFYKGIFLHVIAVLNIVPW